MLILSIYSSYVINTKLINERYQENTTMQLKVSCPGSFIFIKIVKGNHITCSYVGILTANMFGLAEYPSFILCALNLSRHLKTYCLQHLYDVDSVIISSLQIRILCHSELRILLQGHSRKKLPEEWSSYSLNIMLLLSTIYWALIDLKFYNKIINHCFYVGYVVKDREQKTYGLVLSKS